MAATTKQLVLACGGVIDVASGPVILTDQRRRILSANQRGEQVLATERVLVRRDDCLVPAHAGDTQAFNLAHQLAQVQGAAQQRLVLKDNGGRHGVLATLARLSVPRSSQTVLGVLLAGPRYTRPPEADLLRNLLGVTSAEVQLVVGLCVGETLRSYAEARGLSVHTVRTQLRDIYRKSGTRSQIELVRLALAYAH